MYDNRWNIPLDFLTTTYETNIEAYDRPRNAQSESRGV